jgi:hypothetical protein|tara:strand:+ start:192 stop:407 length:216 start_codon:yes stop_codon:yes gene_type:complete
MKFYIYDVQKGKGYWRPAYAGYTFEFEEAGLYAAEELPTHAGDCWIAIPEWNDKPNLRVVEDLKRAMRDNE